MIVTCVDVVYQKDALKLKFDKIIDYLTSIKILKLTNPLGFNIKYTIANIANIILIGRLSNWCSM